MHCFWPSRKKNWFDFTTSKCYFTGKMFVSLLRILHLMHAGSMPVYVTPARSLCASQVGLAQTHASVWLRSSADLTDAAVAHVAEGCARPYRPQLVRRAAELLRRASAMATTGEHRSAQSRQYTIQTAGTQGGGAPQAGQRHGQQRQFGTSHARPGTATCCRLPFCLCVRNATKLLYWLLMTWDGA